MLEIDRRITISRLIDFAERRGEPEIAKACAELAVELGIFNHPLQRPLNFLAELPPVPVHDPSQFDVVAYLERRFPEIRAEIDQFDVDRPAGFRPDWEDVCDAGAWDRMRLFHLGRRNAQACARFPKTASIIENAPGNLLAAGPVEFSMLQPGTHLAPHFGQTNTRLRVHLALRTSPAASMRVGDRTLHWTEGRCLVFDDSFEHEVWHRGTEPRIVLMFSIFHPELGEPDERAASDQRVQELKAKSRCLMQERGLTAIRRTVDDGIEWEHDEKDHATIANLMKLYGLKWIERSPVDEMSFGAD